MLAVTLGRQGGGQRNRPRTLGDDMMPQRQLPQRACGLCELDDDDLVDQLPYQRPHLFQHAVGSNTIHKGRMPLDPHWFPGGEGRGERRRGFDLTGNDPHLSSERAQCQRDSRRQATSAERHYDRIELWPRLSQLQADGPVAENDGRLTHRVNERTVRGTRVAGGHDPPPVGE